MFVRLFYEKVFHIYIPGILSLILLLLKCSIISIKLETMSTIAIAEQIKIIKEVTSQAAKTKESALAFLMQAGLIKKESAQKG